MPDNEYTNKFKNAVKYLYNHSIELLDDFSGDCGYVPHWLDGSFQCFA